MKHHPTLPTFGALVPGAGGVLGAIMRGELIAGAREPDYAVIVPTHKSALFAPMAWGQNGVDVPGAMSLTDGWRNTAAMLQAKCPPAVKARALTIDGLADWYVPSRAEMWALRANVPELFEKDWYWTSTQDGSYDAVAQHFAYGGSYWGGKDGRFRFRPVRKIHLQHFTA